MKIKLLVLILTSFLSGYSQEFSKSDFIKTSWFIDNKNGAFLEKDTLDFIKYSNKAENDKFMSYKENELSYLGHGYFVEIDFKTGRRMNFRTRIDNHIQGFDLKKYKWKYKKEKSTIEIYKENELIMELKPISEKTINISSRYSLDNELLETTEITFLRIK